MSGITETEASESDKPDGWLASLRRSLDRPLMSYHLVIGVSALLLVLGMIMVMSASSVYAFKTSGNSYYLFLRQLMWVGIGFPFAWLASRTPVRYMRKLAYPALIGSVILLVLTLIPALRTEINGNYNWLVLGPLQIQPSELAKLAIVLWAADVLARKENLLDQLKHLLIPLVPIATAVMLLVLKQGDLGTCLIFMAVVLALLFMVGMPIRYFMVLVPVTIAAVLYLTSQKSYRQARLTSFLNPMADPQGDGYQAAHGLMALGSGGWWGVGLGQSREKWGNLPEAHTDFIFAVIGEELGLAGTLVILALFLGLAFVGVRIALRTTDLFVRLAAGGIISWLIAQAVINIGAVLSLLPITGVPLPLVSYGGSAMVPTLIALGLLLSLAKTEPGARAALAARGPDAFGRLIRRLRGRSARRGGNDAAETAVTKEG